MWPNPQISADLVTFTEETLNRKLHFLCNGILLFLYVSKQILRKIYGYVTQEFLGLRKRNFQGSIFGSRKIAPSPNSSANTKPDPDPDREAIFRTPYFYANKNIQVDFQICVSVPLMFLI